MGFLLLSVDYPSEKHRSKFLRNAGPHSKFASPFHKPLAASATDDQWRRVLKAIRESVTDESLLYDQPSPRPLKPNDDNYDVRNSGQFVFSFFSHVCLARFFAAFLTISYCLSINATKFPKAFTGSKWKPASSVDFEGRDPSVVQALSAMMGQDDNTTPYPRYDRCAKCTKLLPTMSRCSRCKIVKYCSRDCQASHWKKVHKQSCVKAQPLALYKIMNGNDGFLMSSEECKLLHSALSEIEAIHSDDIVRCFAAYFAVAADLGGCFVL